MALIIRDGFDFYGAPADAGQNYWDVVDSSQGTLSSTTRFGVGQSYGFPLGSGSGATTLEKAWGSNETTVFFVFSFFYGSTLSGSTQFEALRIYDGSTVQCSISWATDGALRFYRGDLSTLLGTYSGAFAANSWVQMQIKVVINNTTGSFEVRKNGNTSDDFSLTGQNNRSSANNQANKANFYKVNASPTNNLLVDDMAWYHSTSGAPWNDWIGDIRALQVMPNADSSVQFAGNSATINQGQNTQTSTRSLATNTMFAFQSFVNPYVCTVAKVTLPLNASVTGHANLAIYDATGAGGGPGSLITNGTATAVTNPTLGNVDFVFGTPPTLALSTKYWLVLLQDATFVWKSDSSLSSLFNESRTYGSGFDSPMALTANNNVPIIAALVVCNLSGNYSYVQELHEDGATTYVFDATVGHKDLYTAPALGVTPASIYGVSLRGYVAKSDAGARSAAMTMTSGSTVQDGSSFALATTFQNLVMVQDVDPNTSAAWNAAGVNALKFGQKVAA